MMALSPLYMDTLCQTMSFRFTDQCCFTTIDNSPRRNEREIRKVCTPISTFYVRTGLFVCGLCRHKATERKLFGGVGDLDLFVIEVFPRLLMCATALRFSLH